MKYFLIVLGVLAVIIGFLFFAALIGIGFYNGLIEKNGAVSRDWAQIDVQLQRRADLIPNLIETVKGYAAHEKGIFEAVSEARSKLIGAKGPEQKAAASGEFNGALSRLLAISERYPDLKANTNFIRLQDELAGTENRISVARIRYNETVMNYNNSLKKFPGSIFAGMMNLKPAEYFTPPERSAIEKPPQVKF